MRLTDNSLATTIGWVSTCMLACGVSALFSESTRSMSMIWGSFGLTSAVGLDVAARFRERARVAKMKVSLSKRLDRDMRYETEAKAANADIREAVARLLGRTLPTLQVAETRRTLERYPCDLGVELRVYQRSRGLAVKENAGKRPARITNLSESGFELLLHEPVPHQRMTMVVAAADGRSQTMFGEVLWSAPQEDGSTVAGGRFLDALLVEAT
jgi:hypothetical protein